MKKGYEIPNYSSTNLKNDINKKSKGLIKKIGVPVLAGVVLATSGCANLEDLIQQFTPSKQEQQVAVYGENIIAGYDLSPLAEKVYGTPNFDASWDIYQLDMLRSGQGKVIVYTNRWNRIVKYQVQVKGNYSPFMREKEVKQMLQEMDKNHDHKISFKEYVDYFKKLIEEGEIKVEYKRIDQGAYLRNTNNATKVAYKAQQQKRLNI